jgi:hypothetical protein
VTPPAGFVSALHAACDGRAGEFGACFVEQMAKAGATPAAIAFAHRVEDQGYLSGFQEAGRVDLAFAEYPFRANENQLCFLVNGTPPLFDVDELSKLDPETLAANPDYSELAREHPSIAIFRPPIGPRGPPPSGCAAADRGSWFPTSCATAATPARSWARRSCGSISTSRGASRGSRWTASAGVPEPAGTAPMAFRRALTPFDATMVVVGGIIGSGIFMLPSLVAQRLPNAGSSSRPGWGRDRTGRRLRLRELATLFLAGGQYVYFARPPSAGRVLRLASAHDPGRGLGRAITFAQYSCGCSCDGPAAGAAIAIRSSPQSTSWE